MEILVVVGTRPEIIKMAPVVRALTDHDELDLYLIHTGQHYDNDLSESFFSTLELPRPDVNLLVGSGTQHEQTAKGIREFGRVIDRRDARVALAQGDTNAVLATAITASKTPVAFGHVEAGLRSFDWRMPEEINRIVADAVADFAFAPTETAMENLRREGRSDRAYLTGNTIVEACRTHMDIARRKSSIHESLGLEPGRYVTATIHRPINADRRDRLGQIVEALDASPVPVVFPVHPRTKPGLDELNFRPSNELRLIDPLGYLDFLKLLSDSMVAVTDSGGVQEEASILEVPCLTVRPNTERPETVEVGVNDLVTPDELGTVLPDLVVDGSRRERMKGHNELYGDGKATERILRTLIEEQARR